MAPSDAVALIGYAATLPHGVIAVPKMAAMTIADMADAIVPGAPQQVIGLRSLEKQHEDLIHVDELVEDHGDGFLIGRGKQGVCYTSAAAPRLSAAAFLAMLAEAETYE
jgi:FlaA1/EpsC-like NDP-sugar epimerase